MPVALGGAGHGEIFAPLSPHMIANPYAVYERLRADDPVHWHEQLSAWVVTRHDDCTRVLRDTDVFGSDPRALDKPIPSSVLSLQTLDPPAHTAVRHRFLAALRQQCENSWAAAVRRSTDMILAATGDGVIDFVSAIAEPVALNAMCTLYGVPYPADHQRFRDMSRMMILGMDAGLDPSRREPALAARDVLNEMIRKWQCDAAPGGILASVSAEMPDDPVEQRILLNSMRAVFDAGYSTTSNLISNALMWLADQHPWAAAELAALDGRAVDELIRIEGPVQAVSRHCKADVDLRGRTIRRCDVVVLVLAAANHDHEVFPNPRAAAYGRYPNPHLGLGRGTHSCLGGHLGRRVLLILLHALAAHFTRIELAGPWLRRPTATQRGLDRLPVLLHRS